MPILHATTSPYLRVLTALARALLVAAAGRVCPRRRADGDQELLSLPGSGSAGVDARDPQRVPRARPPLPSRPRRIARPTLLPGHRRGLPSALGSRAQGFLRRRTP